MNTILKLKKYRLYYIVVALLCMGTSVGCDAEYSVIDQSIYFADAGSSNSKKVAVDDDGGKAVIAIRSVGAVASDTEISMVIDAAALERYNKQNGTSYMLLDESQYTLPSDKVVIGAGQVISPAINIDIKPMTKEMSLSGNKYAIPITLSSKSEKVLESGKSMMLLLDKVIVTSVPVLNKSRIGYLQMGEAKYNLLEWTIEFRVNISSLGTAVGEKANQAVLSYNGGQGAYIRFGDAMIPGNILQIKTTGTQLNCNNVFLPNRWYHLAFVSNGPLLSVYVDGELDATLDMPGSPTAFTSSTINLCGNAPNTMMSEVRFWNKVRTKNEIANNMFEINPNTEGLVGYWKLNEGEGTDFNDSSPNKYHGSVGSSITWVHGVRSDSK